MVCGIFLQYQYKSNTKNDINKNGKEKKSNTITNLLEEEEKRS